MLGGEQGWGKLTCPSKQMMVIASILLQEIDQRYCYRVKRATKILQNHVTFVQGPICCTVSALCGHCVHLPGNSPKITYHLSASTAKQQSPQDNNQHMRGHMEPRAIRGGVNLAPNTKLGKVQQDANRGNVCPVRYF